MYPDALQAQDLGRSWARARPVGAQTNPFSFIDRISLYKALTDATNLDGYFGEKNERNPLWGLAYQLQWQHSSGRLSIGDRSDAINPASPWGYGNFTLCVIPYLGAIAAGTVPDVALLASPSDSRFAYAYGADMASRTVPEALRPAVLDWQRYFEKVATVQPGDDDEPLRLLLWDAHKTSLDVVAEEVATLTPELYSETEVRFLSGWCRMVDLLAACARRTDHPAIMEGGIDVLPERPLTPSDIENGLKAFTETVQGNVRAVLDLASLSDSRLKTQLWVWRRMMRTRAARDRSEDILRSLLGEDTSLGTRLALLRLIF